MKILVKNRSGHDMSHMGPYLKSFLPYAQKRMGFNRPPTIFFDSDPQNAENVLGKTAYYNPETEEIVVFVDKRHPKDILRSLSHELIHHTQNCRGDLNPEIAGETTPGYAQTNAHMRAMEGEAYLKGNGYYFRDWEDSLKNGLEETNYKHITGDTHKMANYDQLKEDITAKVVAALSEKLKNPKKADLDKDGKLSGYEKKRGAAIEKAMANQNESVEEVNEEEEIEERKKRDTPRDSDRREAEKLKINEEELDEAHCGDREDEEELEEAHCGAREDEDDPYAMARHYTQRDSGKYGSGRNEGKEELEEISSDYGPGGYDPGRDGGHSGRSMTNAERYAAAQRAKKKIKADKAAAAKQSNLEKRVGSAMGGMGYGLEEAQKKEVVEETISNDEWYQNELFESLKKRWTK